jgi:D-glycero-D-manno-heptose 1,7-bisphosphate phosphatase
MELFFWSRGDLHKIVAVSDPLQQVVIFAGGLGTRLGERTRQTPKPIIPVAGKAYLEWQIEMLSEWGFRKFLLLTGYLAEQIEGYFGDGTRWNVKVEYSHEPMPLGTAAALRLSEPKLHNRFLLMNGDTFFPMNYSAFLQAAATEPGKAWLVAVPRNVLEPGAPRGNVELDASQRRVTGYVRGGRDDLDFVHAGMFCLQRSMLANMQQGEGLSVEMALCPSLIEQDRLRAFVCHERFYDMGTPQQLQELDAFLSREGVQRKQKQN